MIRVKNIFGPSTLVAAAFIGPGTVTTCTIVGVTSGYTLLWAMLFSIVATVILQEMAARLGFVTREGLGEALNKVFRQGYVRYIVFFLVISAILIGNAAYEAGNISGGLLGLELVIGDSVWSPLILGGICFSLLWFGSFKLLEKVLVGLVIIMSCFFLVTAIIVRPNLGAIFQGFIPSMDAIGDLDLILGLIGTTVVPYNLFLHASTISKKWKATASLSDIRTENRSAIIMGGFISIMIIITAAACAGPEVTVDNAKDLAIQLEPLFGSYAKIGMGLGLFAAGLSSTLTAPIAAAYAAKGLFGWKEEEMRFKAVWLPILLIGVGVSFSGFKPIPIIKFAQITNAILLPFIAIFLVYISNSKTLLGKNTNSKITNILAMTILFLTIVLSLRMLNNVLGIL